MVLLLFVAESALHRRMSAVNGGLGLVVELRVGVQVLAHVLVVALLAFLS